MDQNSEGAEVWSGRVCSSPTNRHICTASHVDSLPRTAGLTSHTALASWTNSMDPLTLHSTSPLHLISHLSSLYSTHSLLSHSVVLLGLSGHTITCRCL